jgi:hypothetical protein
MSVLADAGGLDNPSIQRPFFPVLHTPFLSPVSVRPNEQSLCLGASVLPRHNLNFTAALFTPRELRARLWEDIRKALCHAQRILCRVESKFSLYTALSSSVVVVKLSLNYSFLAAGAVVFMPLMLCLYGWTFAHNRFLWASSSNSRRSIYEIKLSFLKRVTDLK